MSRELAKISQKRAKVSFGGPGSTTFKISPGSPGGPLSLCRLFSGFESLKTLKVHGNTY